MPTIGSLEHYDGSENLSAYLERLEEYFLANDIGVAKIPDGADENARAQLIAAANRKKVASLLSVLGKVTYGVLQDLCKPVKPNTKTFDELVTLLTEHYQPKTLEVVESYKFHRCAQHEKETVSQYTAKLRRKSARCNFGAFLPRALRDQFIAGIHSKDTQQKLLEVDRNFDQCVTVALADETAVRESKNFESAEVQPAPVNVMKKSQSQKFRKDSPRANSRKSTKPSSTNSSSSSTNSSSSSANTSSSSANSSSYKCYSCGKSDHSREKCRFRRSVCSSCKRRGHIASVCKKNLHQLGEADTEFSDFSEDELFMLDVNAMSSSPINVPVKIHGHDLEIQLDTGCALSLAPMSFYDKYCSHVPLIPCKNSLFTYTGEKVTPLGECVVDITYNDSSYNLPLLIVPGNGIALFGRNWLKEIRLNWQELQGLNQIRPISSSDPVVPVVSSDVTVQGLMNKHSQLFSTGLGMYTGPPVELDIEQKPTFHKARPVPYALQSRVQTALENMEKEGILTRVQNAPCAAPIVPVVKQDKTIRICGDFSVTYNSCAKLVTYPIPKVEDLHVALRGCKLFSILDMSQAYHQIPVAEDSQKWLTVNTHIGLFAYKRIPNGIHSGPGIFQEIMDKVLAGIPKVICYLDDILVAGENEKDHLATLSVVFERLEKAGFKLNASKCQFEKSSVTYLAHKIDADGLHPTDKKLQAIRDAPIPKDVTQLKSFLGLLMFYSRFLPYHSTVLAPLNKLLQKGVPYKWTSKENKAFNDAKELLLNSQTLVHYDDKLPLYLSCDASSYGAGAVLSHLIDGNFRPIAFASCSLNSAQRNYSQLDKEAFSIIFGLKRFHQFLYGRSFTIITDHKPLLTLLSPVKSVPQHCAARLQRWSLILASYDYKLEYRSTNAHSDADSMSRLPLPTTWSPKSVQSDCYFLSDEVVSCVDHEMIKKETLTDPVLSAVYRYVLDGWPKEKDNDAKLQPYKSRKDELTIDQGCLLWGTRVIVPPALRKAVLDELHDTHPGIVRMKMYARSYVWWPNLDAQIEQTVSECELCQQMRADPPCAQVHPWAFPTMPWFRVHIDFAGPIHGHQYLIIVDAYSKYPEAIKMTSTTTNATLSVLREVFSRHGLPTILVSDNGPQLTSEEFENFCQRNGIIHKTSAVHKPASNGQAERVVQIIKSAAKQADLRKVNFETMLSKHLLVYRVTKHPTTGESPSMLLMGRNLRTRMDLIRPSVRSRVEVQQEKMMDRSEKRGCRKLYCGDAVLARNFGLGDKWKHGVIVEILGAKHYVVDVNGKLWKRHIDQLLSSKIQVRREIPSPPRKIPSVLPSVPYQPVQIPNVPYKPVPSVPNASCDRNESVVPDKSVSPENVNKDKKSDKTSKSVQNENPPVSTERRYPSRDSRKQPGYLKDYTK